MAQHNIVGSWGEKVAANLLTAKGMAIVASNWKSGKYELDIIAQTGTMIVFVEVKTRTDASQQDPYEAFTAAKQRRMLLSADAFMHANPSPLTPRFDFIAITGNEHDYKIEHIEDLYMPALRTYR